METGDRDVVRVRLPDPLEPWMAAAFRSAQTVWENIGRTLPGDGVEIVDVDPDVWLCDGGRPLPDTDRPIVAVLHEAPSEGQGISRALLDHTDRLGEVVAARATRVVTCSSASKRSIIERYGVEPRRIDLAPYGVDTSVFRPDGPTSEEMIRHGGGDDRPYVLFVGTVLPRKNLPLLRSAIEMVPTHQLVLVAARCLDPDSPALMEAALAPIGGRRIPNFEGIDTQGLAALMRGAELLCLPSLSEGFGLPVLEAMACGTPVVVSDRGSLPEVVGGGGVIVTPTLDGVVAGLRSAIERREELARAALARAGEQTWERTGEVLRRSVRAAVGGESAP